MENWNDFGDDSEHQEQLRLLQTDPAGYWEQGMEWLVQALRKNPAFAAKIIEVFSLDAVQEKLQPGQSESIKLLYEQLQTAKVKGLHTRLLMFEELSKMEFLSTTAKSSVFALRGASSLAMDNPAEALADFDHALTLNPQDAWTTHQRGLLHMQMGTYEEAVFDLDRASELGEEDTRNRGQAYLSAQLYQEALALYTQAIAVNPNDLTMWCNKGKALENMERYDEALLVYNEAIGLDSAYSDAWYSKGMIFQKLQRYDEALLSYDQVIKLSPQHADAWYSKGVIFQKLQRYDEALFNYDQAIKFNPQHTDAWYGKGITLGKLRRYDEKHAAYHEVIKLNPQYNQKQATSEPNKHRSPNLVSNEYLDTEIVILLQGTNLFGASVYSYLLLTGRKLKRMFALMQAGENFKPANFGAVIIFGVGQPSQEIRDEMKERYNMIDVPVPANETNPLPRTWVEKLQEARK